VIEGASQTLTEHRPAIIMELHEASRQYGHSIEGTLTSLEELGYTIERFASHRGGDRRDREPLSRERFTTVKNDTAVLARVLD
jgi:hypothetical protein